MQLVDRQGNLVEVPDEEAPAAVASGQLGWVRGAPVHVVTDDGRVGKVASQHASAVLARGGRLATPDEVRSAQLDARRGGLGDTLAAGGEGVARGLSLGLSDPLATGVAGLVGGDEAREATRKHLEEEQEAHPYVAGAGQLLGAVAPVLASGGAAAPEEAGLLGARALGEGGSTAMELAEGAGHGKALWQSGAQTLGAIPRAVNAAGDFAEQATAKLLGTGAEGVLGKAAQTATKQAARGIVEGGIFGAGDEVSDATLKNENLTADKLLAHIGHGALLTGAVGATLGGLGSLGMSAITKAADVSEGPIRTMADEQLIRSLNANKKSLITEAKDRFGSLEPVAQRLRTDVGVEAGDSIEDIAKKAATADQKAIDGLQSSVEKVGATGVRVGSVTDALEARAAEFDRQLGKSAAADAIRKQVEDIRRIYAPLGEATGVPVEDVGIPLKHLLEQRRSLEGTINWQTDSVVAQGRKAAGRTIEDSIMNAGDEAAAKSGLDAGAWKAEYQEAKKRFSEVRWIKDVTDDAMDAKIRNRLMSPTDNLAAAAGFIGGSSHGIGGSLGGGIGGLAMGALHHIVRERGNATAAVLLDKLATFDGISQATRDMNERVSAAIAAALSGASPEVSKEDLSEAKYTKEHGRLTKLASMSPGALQQHLEEQTSTIAPHAPGLAKALQQKAKLATSFLVGKLPPASQAATLTPQLTKATSAAPATRAELMRYVAAVEGGPPAILRKLARGTMTLQDAEVLRTVYPDWYPEIQSEVLQKCADRKKPVPFQTAMRLGTLFDVPTCPELDPTFLQLQSKAGGADGPEPGAGGGGGKSRGRPSAKIEIADTEQGPFERASAGS